MQSNPAGKRREKQREGGTPVVACIFPLKKKKRSMRRNFELTRGCVSEFGCVTKAI